ncbi:histidine kinase, partial [Aquicoccus sp. SCR17]|nr:histidine kinase [Carideicomes alvinocaridis]
MQRRLITPFVVLGLVSLAAAALVTWIALAQPWLGLRLVPALDGTAGALVLEVAPDGPAGALRPGDHLRALAPPGDRAEGEVALEPSDLLEEPDALPDIAAMEALYARQNRLHALLSGEAVVLRVVRDGAERQVQVTPVPRRPVGDLPVVYWVQLFVGFCGATLGGWVLAIRGRQPEARYLALAGVGLMVSSYAAALYSSRELALPGPVFDWASAFNSLGAIVFGIGMICLFVVYPVRRLPRWVPGAVMALFGLWALLSFLRLTVTTALMIHIPVVLEMSVILLAVLWQVRATRGNPHARAALRWFGLSVTLGAGGFVTLVALPQAFGLEPQISQGYAFALFLIIYAGLAVGVARFRLFELEFWAFRALFYGGGVALLLLLDAALISVATMEELPAFSLALFIVAFLYLPLRDRLAQWLTGRRWLSTEELFDMITGVAMAPDGEAQREMLHRLLSEMFHPLEIMPAPTPVDRPVLREAGAVMDVPGLDTLSSTRMLWAHRGRRLFSVRDLQRVADILQMAAQFIERRRAYEEGAEQERRRINRDMHDNIGVQLLGALHSAEAERKDALIRQTLTDLREIISNPGGEPVSLTRVLGDLRAELSEHLASADIALDWREPELEDSHVAPQVANGLRAILREAVNNVLRHAGAARVAIRVRVEEAGGDARLHVTVTDDGRGPGVGAGAARGRGRGNGLRN